jgi:hypothetical protein
VFGSEGNSATVAVYTTSGTNLELRDHQKFDGANWVAAPYTMGIRVGADRTYTIADLEKAILLYSKLVKVLTPDVAPTKTITAASTLHTGPFFGATTTPATGESVGLSGFACEVGVDRGMFRRLPAAQKA